MGKAGVGTASELIGRFAAEIDDRRMFYGLLASATVLAAIVQPFASGLVVTTLYFIFMYVALAQAWNYISGYTGYGTFGPHAFIGLGAYALGAQVVYLDVSWPVALVGVAIVAVVVGAVLGVILLRISGIYFAIATLLVAEGMRLGFLAETTYMQGSIGLTIVRLSSIEVYALFGVLALASTIIAYETATSEFGLRLMAIREDEQALRTLGVNPLRYKLPAFVIHAVITSLAGAVYALSLGFLFPDTFFSIDLTITILLIVILGGISTVWGPVIGALLLIPLQEGLRLEFPDLHVLIFGVALVALVIYLPGGVMSKVKSAVEKRHSRGM
ncbi:branched-chain amino acid ABC transporter permease [Natrarchaeobius oligotrophus]|uniref:Branched-chain amino acid ABC transporter permease n=1 Tax=Natrarchaeobius chitinivorans TaxID=1679083 RepID=A0A3N6MH87_NATCH|nr:branched-chain amino acid ABC transporter permease [Natrarchaeobius chitinivorans]RQH02458.1 branched-chain amino acid ABC transporter permease [Natrarchaeobius chitinivorans]